jgi:hypothetical protein
MFPRYVKFFIDEINRNGIIYISLKVSLKRDEQSGSGCGGGGRDLTFFLPEK